MAKLLKSGYGSLGALLATAATSFASGSARTVSRATRGATPALGNEVNNRPAGGGAGYCNQIKRRKLAWSNVGRKRGVRCQGRPAGKGRRHR